MPKLSALGPMVLVWGRTTFACLALIPFIRFNSLKMTKVFHLLGTGVVLTVHWVSFFLSIQKAGLTQALLAYSSFPLFVVLLSLILRQPLSSPKVNGISSLGVLLGVGLLLKSSPSSGSWEGLLWGLLAALTFGLLALINKKLVKDFKGREIAFYQNLVASLTLSACLI